MTGQTAKRRDRREQRRQRRKTAPPPPSFFARYRVAIIAVVVVAGVVLVGLVFLQSATAKAYTCGTLLTPAANQSDPNSPGFATQEQGFTHVPVGSTINYGFCPPTSGNHYNSPPRGPIPPAVYGPSSEQAPGGWVHNLEHGYVVLLYRCPSGAVGQGDCATSDEMAAMQQWFTNAPIDQTCGARKALVARFDSMSTRFGVLAWNRALLIDDLGAANLALANDFTNVWTNTNARERGNCLAVLQSRQGLRATTFPKESTPRWHVPKSP